MTSKSNLNKFKTTMKRETTRNINIALKLNNIFKSQADKFIDETKNIIDNGTDEKIIMNDLAIHAHNSNYKQYIPLEKLLKELEHEKKQYILQPPLEDTSTFKDVKKYTKEMVNARVKNAANKQDTAMERERKFRRQNMIDKSRELLPKNLQK